MSELEINDPTKEVPDALKIDSVVNKEEEDTDQKKVAVNEIEKTDETVVDAAPKPKPKPVIKADRGESFQSVESGPVGFLLPLVGIDAATQLLPGGITKGERSAEETKIAEQQNKIANLSYEDFKKGVADGSIEQYKGRYFDPVMAESDSLLVYYEENIGSKQRTIQTPSGEIIKGTITPVSPYDSILSQKPIEDRTKAENKAIADNKTLRLLQGKFKNVDELADTRLKNIMTKRINTTEFFPVLSERLQEVGRGTLLELPALIEEYIGTSFFGDGLGDSVNEALKYKKLTGVDFSEAWKATSSFREKKVKRLRNFFGKFGLKQLSDVMNEMIFEDLQQQYKDGDISKDRFNQLTVSPSGAKVRYIDEQTAQDLLEISYESLTGPEQFGIIGIENLLFMGTLGTKTQATIKRNTEGQIKFIKAKMIDDTELAKMGIAGAAYHLRGTKELSKLDLSAIRDGLHVRKNEAYFQRLDNQITDKEEELSKVMFTKGVNSKEYRIVQNDIRALRNKRFKDKVTFGTLPILKKNVKEVFPMSIAQYFVGGVLEQHFDVTQFEAESYALLGYIMGGGFVVKGSLGYLGRKGRDLLVYQVDKGGTQKRNFLNFLETNKATTGFVNFVKKQTGYDINPRGLFTNASLESYNERLINQRGFGLTRAERKNANYVLELASVMDDNNLARTLNSITKLTTIEDKFVKSFPVDLQKEARNMFRTDFATSSQIGALEAAGALVNNKVSLRHFKNLNNINKYIDIDSENRKQLERNAFAIEGLKRKLLQKGISDDNKNAAGYIEAMEEANKKFIQRLDTQLITLESTLKKARTIMFEDPTLDIPEAFHELVNGVTERVRKKVTKLEGIGEEAFAVEKEAIELTKSLQKRLDKIKRMKDDAPAHNRAMALTAENFLVHQLYKLRDGPNGAARNFRAADELALEKKVQIDMGDAVIDLWNRAGESDIQAFFSPSSALFGGVLGKKAKNAFERMAERAFDAIPPEVQAQIMDMAQNPKLLDNPKLKGLYVGDDPSPLEVSLAFMKYYKENNIPLSERMFKPFLGSPKDVNEMHSAFVEYGIKIKDDKLTAQYLDYGDVLDKLIFDTDEEVHAAYKLGAETYQNEWFDRIRSGPLGKLLKAREGPQKVASKKTQTEILEKSLEEGVDIDRTGFAILANDNVFKFAYKSNTNPLTVFKPLTDKIIKASKGDIDAEAALPQAIGDLMENFGSRIANKPGFDLTNKLDKENFVLFKKLLTGVVRATYAQEAIGQLEKVTRNPRVREALKRKNGGYDFESWKELDKISKSLKFTVKKLDKDGNVVVRQEQVLDVADILVNQKDIVNQMNRFPELQNIYQNSIIKRFDEQSDILRQQAKTDNKIEQFVFQKVQKAYGIGLDHKSFYQRFVTGGTPEDIAQLKELLLKELSGADTLTAIPNAERRVFEKQIDEGLVHLLVKGQLEEAGIKNATGMVDIDRIVDEGSDKDMFIDPLRSLLDKVTSKRGIDGNMYPIKVITRPEDLLDSMKNPTKREIFSQFMDEDHLNYYENMLEYMVMVEKGDFSRVKLEGLTRGITTNEAISRAFNLARGMVSPTYVAAEFAVRIAEMSGIQLLGMVGQDKEAARILVDVFKVGVKPSDRDVGTLANKITTFVFKEMARMGITPPDFENKTEAEIEAEIEDYKEKMKFTQ